jgi:hypothetical protein
LLIEGEAGIGKTTIWTEAARLAGANARLLTARPSESEAKLSFSVLTDLFEPTLREIQDELPVPQRRALELALLLKAPVAGTRVDARAVSLGTLGVLRSLAARMPLTIAIDDVHWMDAASARSLSFALRRLVDESITVVAARRVPGPREPIGLTNMTTFRGLRLGPLPADAIAQSLHQVDGPFPRPLVKRIHEASGGNPFYAREIGRALTRLSSHPRAGEPLPIPDDLHALLRERLKPLSADARDALLIVAASPSPSADLVAAVAGSDIALEEAAQAEIVTMRGTSVVFTHPLLASAVYADAAPSTRRGVHERLAAVSTDPEQRARHLALSSTGPDEEAASSLDRAAVQARARGAPQVAAELSELAVTATPIEDFDARQRRTQMQAGNLFDAGDPRRGREIIEALIPRLEPGPARAEARFMLSSFAWKDLRRVSELLHQALAEADGMSLRSREISLDTRAEVSSSERSHCRERSPSPISRRRRHVWAGSWPGRANSMPHVRRSSPSWTVTESRVTRRPVTRSSRTSRTSNTEPDDSIERSGTSRKRRTSRPRGASMCSERSFPSGRLSPVR